MKKIWLFVRELDPIKLALDIFTVVILTSFIIEFFLRQVLPAIPWLAEFYRFSLPLLAGYHELNRWLPATTAEQKALPWTKRKKIIQGEYYVLAWITIPVILIFCAIIWPNQFTTKPELLLNLAEWVIGIFLASSGSKKFQQLREQTAANAQAKPEVKPAT